MSLFKIDQSTGLGSFPILKEKYQVINYVTYDNQIWGNMNPTLTHDEEEKEKIQQKDYELARIVGTKKIGVATTPPEGSIINLDQRMFLALDYAHKPNRDGYKFIRLGVNAVILTVPDIELLFAPRDCPIAMFVHPQWSGVLAIHLGAPQIAQNLVDATLKCFQALYPKIKMSKFCVFITPYICSQHYQIDHDRYQLYQHIIPNLDHYVLRTQDQKYHLDFTSIMMDQLKSQWQINQIYESQICAWEEAQKGHLFSYTLTKQKPDQYPPGAFNVVMCLKH